MRRARVVVLIADIVTSRAIVRRKDFQTKLAKGLASLSKGRKDILSPYTVTLGDEFQAVLSSGRAVLPDFYRIQGLIHPHRARLAIGVGPISTEVNREMAIGMDGPAFHAARSAMGELKASNGLARVAFAAPSPARWINPCLDLLSQMLMGWRDNRIEIATRLLEGLGPTAIAHTLDLTPSAVYKNIQAGSLEPISQIATALGEEIDNAMG